LSLIAGKPVAHFSPEPLHSLYSPDSDRQFPESDGSVCEQLRALADGLALGALLRGEKFSEETWVLQLAAT